LHVRQIALHDRLHFVYLVIFLMLVEPRRWLAQWTLEALMDDRHKYRLSDIVCSVHALLM